MKWQSFVQNTIELNSTGGELFKNIHM